MNLQKVALDSANPADLAIIRNLSRNPSTARHIEHFNWFTDPDTKIDYYTPRDSAGDLYTTDMAHPENIALDANNPADKAVIDKLVQHQVTSRGQLKYPQPPNFLVYENTLNNRKVYSWVGDDGVTRYSYVTDSYPGITADSPEGQALIPNLRPYMVNKVETTYITDIEAIPNGFGVPSISTQQAAQGALVAIDRAIVSKDQIRAHLGALQNRLENTVTNLNIQAENMQNAESRISDADVANEMTTFVRNQILTQSAVAMLGQANSYPHMLMGLING